MSGIRAIFVDIDDTLYPTTEFTWMARRKAVEAMIEAGLNCDAADVLLELEELVREFSSNDSNHYDRLMQRMPAEALVGANPLLIVAAGVAAYHDTKFRALRAYPDVVDVMPALAAIPGVRLGVLTSGIPVKQAEKLVRLQYGSLIDSDAFFVAERLGYSKTNANFYSKVSHRMGIQPGQCIQIGDKLAADVISARKAGFKTIWMERGVRPVTEEEIQAAAPDHVCNNFYEVQQVLKDAYGLEPKT